MPETSFQIGDELNAVFVFTNRLTNVLADPGVVKVKFKVPAGTSTTYTYLTDAEVTKVSTGVYRFRKILATSGRYVFRAEGTSGLTGAVEEALDVDTSAF